MGRPNALTSRECWAGGCFRVTGKDEEAWDAAAMVCIFGYTGLFRSLLTGTLLYVFGVLCVIFSPVVVFRSAIPCFLSGLDVPLLQDGDA